MKRHSCCRLLFLNMVYHFDYNLNSMKKEESKMDFPINRVNASVIIAVQANIFSKVTRACPKPQTILAFFISR